MLFKPEGEDAAKAAEVRKPGFWSRVLKRMVSLTVTLVILGGLGYIGWYAVSYTHLTLPTIYSV